jgi:hypothetical protein
MRSARSAPARPIRPRQDPQILDEAPRPAALIAAHKSRMTEAHNAGLLRLLARRVRRLEANKT